MSNVEVSRNRVRCLLLAAGDRNYLKTLKRSQRRYMPVLRPPARSDNPDPNPVTLP